VCVRVHVRGRVFVNVSVWTTEGGWKSDMSREWVVNLACVSVCVRVCVFVFVCPYVCVCECIHHKGYEKIG